ncbi:MAG: sugar ABC transporter permease, partial [Clostridia bacterium]|nr:sugar ABC transporter permease [Clostridia bacterium]
FLSGLQTISPSLYESARCDAATGWEMFWFITLPMMSPIILLTVVYTIIDSFADINNQVMGYILQMKTEMDYAAAIGWIYFVFIFLVVILLYGILGRRVYQEKGR